jgi:hypothetical protein
MHRPAAKSRYSLSSGFGMTEEVVEKLLPKPSAWPQRLKPDSKRSLYRSAEALRHPKAGASQSFSATSEVVPFQNNLKLSQHHWCELISVLRGEGQGEDRFLFHFVRFGRSGGWAGTGGAFDRMHGAIANEVLEARQDVEKRTHVGRLLLHPDNISRRAMALEFGGELGFGEGIHLLQKNDGGARVVAASTLGAEFVTDLAGAEEDAFGVVHFGVGNYGQKFLMGQVCDF